MPRAIAHGLLGAALTPFVLLQAAIAADHWLPELPRSVVIERVQGTTRVNGVELQLALATTGLSTHELAQQIAAGWRATSEHVAERWLGSARLVARRAGRWHDTATISKDAAGNTRVVFSRLNVRARVRNEACRWAWPPAFTLRSTTMTADGGERAEQCVADSRLEPAAALAALEATWRRDGWARDAGASAAHDGAWAKRGGARSATWRREGRSRHVVALPASRASIVTVLQSPEPL